MFQCGVFRAHKYETTAYFYKQNIPLTANYGEVRLGVATGGYLVSVTKKIHA